MLRVNRGGRLRSLARNGATRLRSGASFARHIGLRLDDVVTNQALLAQRLALNEVNHFSEPCADEPLSSRLCRQADFGREHAEWIQVLAERPVVFRKEWEHTAICRALDAAGMLRPGARGLGFGVGREPLVAAFAARGVSVVATDLSTADARAASWASTNQHALSIEGLQHPGVCLPTTLADRVTVRAVDMTAIPNDLIGFDFVWSACAFEHLGSLEAGLAFVERAMDCLAPGGLAVHTTEFNLDSDDETAAAGHTVAYRRRDMAELERRLARKGHTMAPFTIAPRDGVLDNIVDVPPYHYQSLLLRLGKHRITSAVVVVRRASD